MPLLDLFDGLFEASWRDVEFHMVRARDETGRRWVKFTFPGRDQAAWEDLGADDGPIVVTGLIIGDDYIFRAKAMQQAAREAGPGTLVHPWLGEMQVVLAQPLVLDWSDREVGIVRFEAVFERWQENLPPGFDTLGGIIAAAYRVRSQVRGFLRRVLAPVRLALGVVAAIGGFARSLSATVGSLAGGLRNGGGLLASLTAPFAGLTAIGGLTVDGSYGVAVADRLDAVPAAIAIAAMPAPPPAVTPATPLPEPAQISPADGAALLLAQVTAIPGLTLDAPQALVAAAQAQAAVAAMEAAARIPFESQQDAAGWKARVDAGLALAADAAVVAAQATPLEAGGLWQALQAARAAWAVDMDARIGRLPAVRAVTLAGAAPVALLAHALAGDAPGQVIATAEDLVLRNRLRLPGLVPPGTLETLAR
jgi:prophage DNA circulation protein